MQQERAEAPVHQQAPRRLWSRNPRSVVLAPLRGNDQQPRNDVPRSQEQLLRRRVILRQRPHLVVLQVCVTSTLDQGLASLGMCMSSLSDTWDLDV